jgi:hypothetical protein
MLLDFHLVFNIFFSRLFYFFFKIFEFEFQNSPHFVFALERICRILVNFKKCGWIFKPWFWWETNLCTSWHSSFDLTLQTIRTFMGQNSKRRWIGQLKQVAAPLPSRALFCVTIPCWKYRLGSCLIPRTDSVQATHLLVIQLYQR